ncbi:MAG: triose-phosphate isomerase [Myxococcaceae bacterium]
MIIGNWKLNHLRPKMLEVLSELLASNLELAVAPVATLLSLACERTQNSKIKIAAQNVCEASHGAFTGEWSVEHLTELGVSMAIIGHSERRQYYGETSKHVAQKAKACLEGGLIPVVCIGESLLERESGQVYQILEQQLEPVLKLNPAPKIVIAYEPIWAIGTGKNALPEEIREVHAFLRSHTSAQTKLLYGGSVNANNAASIFAVSNVNGALVGGASLETESFLAIAKAALK